MMRPARIRVGLLLLLLAGAPVWASSPWQVLEEMRRDLADAGPTEVSFVQTYRPAEFATGDEESGQMYLELPDCLRWDYQQPYRKSFLLCREVVHTWNPDDGTGQRYEVNREAEPGLDLLLLNIDDLRLRYRAESRELEGGVVELKLSPVDESTDVREALLHVDAHRKRLEQLEYRDREGNVTRFRLTDYRALPDRHVFVPPANVQWLDEP